MIMLNKQYNRIFLLLTAVAMPGCHCNPALFKTNNSDTQLEKRLSEMFSEPTTSESRISILREAQLNNQITGGIVKATSDASVVYIPVSVPKCQALYAIWAAPEGLIVEFGSDGRLKLAYRVFNSNAYGISNEEYYSKDARRLEMQFDFVSIYQNAND
jgi:hypothetical protein